MMKREKMTGMQEALSRPVAMGLLALFCCALWGSAFPCIKIGYRLFQISAGDTGSVILFAGLRFALAGIMVILAGSAMQGRRLVPRRGDIVKIAKLCTFQTVFQYFFFYIGLAHASGVKSAIITGSNSLLTILMSSRVFRQEKLTPAKAAGCLLGFLGVAAANLTGGGMDQNVSFLGEGFVFLSAVSYAVSSALIKRYSADADPVLLSGWQFLAGGAVAMPHFRRRRCFCTWAFCQPPPIRYGGFCSNTTRCRGCRSTAFPTRSWAWCCLRFYWAREDRRFQRAMLRLFCWSAAGFSW